MSLVSTRRLIVAHGTSRVLRDVSLTIEAGEIVTIVGPNGSGKTSLLRAIIGAIEPANGEVVRKPGLRIGYVPERLHIDQTLTITVERFLQLTVRIANSQLTAALQTAGVPEFRNRQMSQLSGGQFQRALLARALVNEPDLLLLDEASQGLDQAGSAAFYGQIEALHAETGCAVLMISHELHVVMSASDRVVCINGDICCDGTPAVVASAAEFRALFGTGGALARCRHEHDNHHPHGKEAAE